MKKNYLFWVAFCVTLFCNAQTEVFINEIHYENSGGDLNEGVEIAGPAGTNLEDWQLIFYNGSNGEESSKLNLSGTIPNFEKNRGTIWFLKSPIQNEKEGIALVNPNSEVVQFLSYEGIVTANEGAANEMTSTDIGVSESSSTSSTSSLQLSGSGSYYDDFTWVGSATATNGEKNNSQNFTAKPYILSDFSISGMNYELGFGPSNVESFLVEGRNLTNNIIIIAPASYEISTNTDSGWTSEIQLSPTSEVVSPTTIYVRLKSSLTIGLYNENISISSNGAIGKSIAVSGEITPVATHSLVITGVFDGPLYGGTPKGIEIYVINDIPDLSIYGLGSVANGGGNSNEEFSFPNDAVKAEDYIYVSSGESKFYDFFGFNPNYTDISMNINGDDAIELFENGNAIDVFGDINTDGTGEPWEYLDGWAYRNSEGPSATFNISDWDYSGVNALDGETTNATALNPFPLGTYDSEVLSVVKNEIEGFSVYPNPITEDYLCVKTKFNLPKNIELYSIHGKQVLKKVNVLNELIDLKSIQPGLYILKVEESEKVSFSKIIISNNLR